MTGVAITWLACTLAVALWPIPVGAKEPVGTPYRLEAKALPVAALMKHAPPGRLAVAVVAVAPPRSAWAQLPGLVTKEVDALLEKDGRIVLSAFRKAVAADRSNATLAREAVKTGADLVVTVRFYPAAGMGDVPVCVLSLVDVRGRVLASRSSMDAVIPRSAANNSFTATQSKNDAAAVAEFYRRALRVRVWITRMRDTDEEVGARTYEIIDDERQRVSDERLAQIAAGGPGDELFTAPWRTRNRVKTESRRILAVLAPIPLLFASTAWIATVPLPALLVALLFTTRVDPVILIYGLVYAVPAHWLLTWVGFVAGVVVTVGVAAATLVAATLLQGVEPTATPRDLAALVTRHNLALAEQLNLDPHALDDDYFPAGRQPPDDAP
ncbi:MAG: hypothetical protein AB2A00_36505 [Myxococcota bacterium]